MSCVRSQAYLGVQLSQKFNNKNIEGIEHVIQSVAKWVVFRFDIAEIIADVGEDAHHIWGELLKGNRGKTFSLLVLMGYEIRGEQIEEQTGFWKYVFDHRKLDQILDRDFTDEKGNSLFHYCASAESGEEATKLLKILPCESFTDLHEYRNRNLNNILHEAMRTGKCGVFDG